ncbi:MAG: high-affinity branched-chain amino acid ABC transporter permease LivM [Thermodesulfobacteriota bacterium]
MKEKSGAIGREVLRGLGTSLWFCFLTFPLLAVRVNTIEKTVVWRLSNMVWVALASFFLAISWRWLLSRRERKTKRRDEPRARWLARKFSGDRRLGAAGMAAVMAFALAFPFVSSMYQTSLMITALIYVMLGLGLNIVVGLAGLLDLGYVAFYAVGAYSYALLNLHFPWYGFWMALPVGALLAAMFGVLLGFPVLRLRGDYLAIVTLGFGEIIRLILENWNAFSKGPSGIANIPRPSFFGLDLSLHQATLYLYFLMLAVTGLTVIAVMRLRASRIGRAWMALREDEIACECMGIDKTRTKLTAFALGATWAGMAGVIFAAKTTFINPASFTFMESAIILSIVVLGGMGSILGVILASLIMILLPQYLGAFSQYRMLLFGSCMVAMIVFRPQGLVTASRSYRYVERFGGRKAKDAGEKAPAA